MVIPPIWMMFRRLCVVHTVIVHSSQYMRIEAGTIEYFASWYQTSFKTRFGCVPLKIVIFIIFVYVFLSIEKHSRDVQSV